MTISGNEAGFRGGGIANRFSGVVILSNSIVWGNNALESTLPAREIFNGDIQGGSNDSSLRLYYSLYRNNAGDIAGISPIVATNTMTLDPLFVDADNGNFRLRPGSPARNAGDRDTDYSRYPGGIANPVDLDGNPRIFDWPGGGNIDLGPYELQRLPAAGPRYVATDGDDTRNGDHNHCTIAADPCASIRHALEEALTGEEIHIGPGIFTDIIHIHASISITGAGAGFDPGLHTIIQAHEQKGEADGRVFTIDRPEATQSDFDVLISGAAIRHGFPPGNWNFQQGGGIYNRNASLTLHDVILSDNMGNRGAGLYNLGTAYLSNVIFRDNETNPTTGGGVLRHSGGGMVNSNTATLVNVVFSSNTANRLGGGLVTGENSNTNLLNVTFHGNSAENGGGIYNYKNAAIEMRNTILWGNSATDRGNEIQNEPDGVITASYNLYRHRFGLGDIIFGGNGFTTSNRLRNDPLFSDADAGDFSLQEDSPGINAGDPDTDLKHFPTNTNGLPIDLAGNPRLSDGRIDMGAFEYPQEPISPDAPDIPLLSSPADNTTNVSNPVTLSWNRVESAVSYRIQVIPNNRNFDRPLFDVTTDKTSLNIPDLEEDVEYSWRVLARNEANVDSAWSETWHFTVSKPVSATLAAHLPTSYSLHQNYPNPFNPATTITYELPESSHVRLFVTDILGRTVSTLINSRQDAGYHRIAFDAGRMSSGMYFYILQTEQEVITRTMTLVK